MKAEGGRKLGRWCLGLAIAISFALGTFAQGQGAGGGKKRATAPPPKFDDQVREGFFPDAREKLTGERPQYGKANGGAGTAGGTASGGSDVAAPTGGGDTDWTKIVSAEALENEIKGSVSSLAESVKSPQKFKGGGHKVGRTAFSVNAVVFGVIADYKGDVRWKDKAAPVRDQMAKASVNCKVATDLAYKDAKDRVEDLTQMVRGTPPSGGNAEDFTGWLKIAERPPLMQRMEHAKSERLLPLTANAGDFKAKKDEVLHEAQILAMLARVIQDSSYDYADDTGTYQSSAKEVEAGALAVVEAVKQGDAAAAQKAMGDVTKACDRCHGEYR